MESLESVLAKNKSLLGENYENLGKTVGKGLFQKKILIAYHGEKKGWEVVKFNLFKQFFRKYFGFYHATHLKHVVKFWDKYKIGQKDTDPVLGKRLSELWQKTYPTQELPTFNLFFSNKEKVSLENIDLFVFAEKHTKQSHRKFIAEIINQYYRPGDLILVEESNEKPIEQKECAQLKFVKPGCSVKGWDITKNLYKNTKPIQMFKELQSLCTLFPDRFPKSKAFTKQQKEQIIKELPTLLKEIDPHLSYFLDKKEKEKLKKDAFENIKTLIENGSVGKPVALKYVLLHQLATKEMQAKAEKWKYRNATLEDSRKVREARNQRDALLAKTIEENSAPGRRLFVIAGALHLAKSSKASKNIEQVTKALKKHNFVLTVPRRIGEKFHFTQLNPDYIKVQNPF